MLACAGYLLTMVADCVVSSVFRSDEKAGDLELLLFFFSFFFLFFFLFGILAKFQLMLMNGMLILKVEALGIGEIYELIVLVKYTGSD